MKSPKCPYCHNKAILIDSRVIHGKSYGLIWMCSPCKAWVGVHKNSPTHKPLGSLAKEDLRILRMKAHEVFDSLWRKWGISRKEAYVYLQNLMDMTPEQAHIGRFNEYECRKLIKLLKGRGRKINGHF